MKSGLSLILAKVVVDTLQPSGIKVGYDIDFAAFYRLLTQSGGAWKSGHSAFYAVVAKCAKPLFIPPLRTEDLRIRSVIWCGKLFTYR